jgi:putative membrane protein
MRIVTWTIRLVVFLLLIALAAKNIEPVTLRFYFDLALQAPLVLWLFGFFAAGALFGALALAGSLLRQRLEISSLKRQLEREAPAAAPAQVLPPPI